MINKQARGEAQMLKELANLTKGMVVGGVGGAVGGKAAGKALFNRKLRKLPLPKKLIHKLRLAMSKSYRSNVDLDRKIWGDKGAALGANAGFHAGIAFDRTMLKKRMAGFGGSNYRRGRAGRQYRTPGGDLNKSLKNLGIPKKDIKTKAEAKKYFRKRAFETHPDRHPGKSTKEFLETKASWDNVQASSWYEKLAYVLHKQAAKKSTRKLLDVQRLKELMSKAGKGSSKLNLNKLMGRNLPKSFVMGLAAFGGGAALSRLASKASQKLTVESEAK